MTLTKEKVIMNVSVQLGLGPGEAWSAVEQVLELIVRQKNSRLGRNPQTREDLLLRARRVVVFKTSGVLRQRLNSPPQGENVASARTASLLQIGLIIRLRAAPKPHLSTRWCPSPGGRKKVERRARRWYIKKKRAHSPQTVPWSLMDL